MVEGRASALTFYYISFGPVVNFFYITPFQSGPLSVVLASGNCSLTSCHSFASSRISYKWSYSACPLLCPASFTLHNAVEIHLYCCTCRQVVHCCWHVTSHCMDVQYTYSHISGLLSWITFYKYLSTSFCVNIYILLDKYMSESARSYGECVFSFIRNCQMSFQSDYTMLHFHQQGTDVPAALESHQYLVLSVLSATVVDME